MQNVLWCFFGWRGQLNRQQFLLAMIVIGLLNFAAGNFLTDLMVGPTNNGEEWHHSDLMAAREKATLIPIAASLWPAIVVQIKRLRHIGMPVYSLFAVHAGLLTLLLIWPRGWAIALLVWTGFLFLVKGSLVRWASE